MDISSENKKYIKKGEYRKKIEIYSSLKSSWKPLSMSSLSIQKIGLNSFSAINHVKIQFHTLLNNVWEKTHSRWIFFHNFFCVEKKIT